MRNFFREEVARRDGNASHIVCPCLPDADWSPHFRVPLSKGTSVAPQREDRTRDATAGEPIFRVVLPVQRGCRAVLLADGVNGYWIAQRSDVGSTHLGVENTRRRTPRRESILNDCIRSCCEETLGQGLRLRQQRPGPKGSHESRIGELPYVLSWHDIEDGKTVNKRRMIQGQAICHAAAAIVPRNAETSKSEACHHSNHVPRHGALRIRFVVARGGWTTALSISAQIGANNAELLRQQRRHPPPHQVGLREAVKQQQRRPSTSPAHEYAGFAGLDLSRLELLQDDSDPTA